jgi:LuxR family maltose regulon positive regulatory protein
MEPSISSSNVCCTLYLPLQRRTGKNVGTPTPELAPSTAAYLSKLLAAFGQEQQDASPPVMAATTGEPALASARQASAVSLTRREQEVLRLLAAGASNQDIAHTLVISLDTVKKHVSNLLGKLGASNRTQAISQARARSLL